jgi:hypothetical protein
MPSSAIVDLAIGLIFVFGVTAALASVLTELVSRFIGLRSAYLLTGLRELVDGHGVSTDLGKAQDDYQAMRDLVKNGPAALAGKPVPSVTGALLGSPILSSQGMVGQIQNRSLTIEPAKRGSLHKMTADRQKRTADQQKGTADQQKRTASQQNGTADQQNGTADQQKRTADQQNGTASQQKGGVWRQRRSLPAYFSAESFAEAVIDLVAPDTAGKTTPDAAGKTTPDAAGETVMATIQRNVDRLPDPFKSSLQALARNADDDVSRFRTSVERWYDDHMSRVSGWYKRHVGIITLILGAILIVLLNINVLTIGRTLYSQNAVSTAVSQVAAKGTNCPPSKTTQECLSKLQAQLSAAATAGLPIGWGTVRDCQPPRAGCNWMDQRGLFSRHGGSFWQFVLVLVGFLLMVIAIVPGAQFWFGLLSKIGSIKSTGPKPAGAGS